MDKRTNFLITAWCIGVIGILETWFLEYIGIMHIRNIIFVSTFLIFIGIAFILIVELSEFISNIKNVKKTQQQR